MSERRAKIYRVTVLFRERVTNIPYVFEVHDFTVINGCLSFSQYATDEFSSDLTHTFYPLDLIEKITKEWIPVQKADGTV